MHCRHTSTPPWIQILTQTTLSFFEKNKFNHFYIIESAEELLQQVKPRLETSPSVNMVCFSHSSPPCEGVSLAELSIWWMSTVGFFHVRQLCRVFALPLSQGQARILKVCCSFLNVSREIWPPLSIEGTCSHTVQRLTQIPGSTEWVAETRSLISECGRAAGVGGGGTKHAAFFTFLVFLFSFSVHHIWFIIIFDFQRLIVSPCTSQ